MKKNYLFLSTLIWGLCISLVFIGRYYYNNVIFGNILSVIYSLTNHQIVKVNYKKYLKYQYTREYINICQNNFGVIPLGILSKDMEVSPWVNDDYDDTSLKENKFAFKLSLILIGITIAVIVTSYLI